MATKKCMSCGGSMSKMKSGGPKTGNNASLQIYGIPNAGRTDQLGFKKGGAVKNAKLAALAPPKNKITRADIITGAKKRAAKKK